MVWCLKTSSLAKILVPSNVQFLYLLYPLLEQKIDIFIWPFYWEFQSTGNTFVALSFRFTENNRRLGHLWIYLTYLFFLPSFFLLLSWVAGFVRNLRNKKKWLVAFTYVYAFELGDKVSPVSLLKDYVSHSKQIAKQILHAGNSSYEAQVCSLLFPFRK